MKKQAFITSVRNLTTPEDFQNNHDHLNIVEPYMREAFCSCLKMGGMIIPSLKAMEMIDKISKETVLEPKQVVDLSSKFRWINAMIDERPEYPNPA
ncbi:hypothetical protein [Draconibacterium orientale]|uniref:hypothetical protein n=1 Tax=Draconibacterium orientale TaxID=1168034 RepID=UPI0029BFBB22|nr:hypothetical protein [Draconibacterium orientale]